jgi:hypothetical protein
MGKQAAQNGGRGSGKGGRGGGGKNNRTVDAAALGLGGTPPTPATTSIVQPTANPTSAVPGMDPNLMSMLAMAQAFNGGQQQGQTMNVAFSQAQLLQVMQAVQANNAAQQAAEEAARDKALADEVAKAVAEKDAEIEALRKENLKKKARNPADEHEESDEEEEEDEEPQPLTKNQLKRARRKKFLADNVSSKQTLQAQLAAARAEAELAQHKAMLLESTVANLKSEVGNEGADGEQSSTRSKTDLHNKITHAEEQARLSTPQKEELDVLIAAHLASIQAPNVDSKKVEQPDHAGVSKPKVSFAPQAKYKSLGERIAARKGSTSTDSGTEQEGSLAKKKLVLQMLDNCLGKTNDGKPLDTTETPADEDIADMDETVQVLVLPWKQLTGKILGTAKTELVEGLGNKYGIHMASNNPEEFLQVALFNMAWHEVYVEDEPEYPEMVGYHAATAKPAKSEAKKAKTRGEKKKKK